MVVVLFVSSSNYRKEGPNKRGPFPFAPKMFPVQASDQYDVGLTRCPTQNQKSQESSHVTVYSRAGCSVSPLGIQGTWQSPIQKQQRKHASIGWTPEAPVRVEVPSFAGLRPVFKQPDGQVHSACSNSEVQFRFLSG